MRNRWGIDIRTGLTVVANAARGGTVRGTVTKIDRSSDFAKAYGAQVHLDTGSTVGADDVKTVEKPAT
jgi:hypothetical protein